MSPAILDTPFFWLPIGGQVNAAPQVGKKKSTSCFMGTFIYSLLHDHLSHTWPGKGREQEKRKGNKIRNTTVIDCFILS